MAARQLKISSGGNEVLYTAFHPNYFIVRSIFHNSGSANWTIGIALCPVGSMTLKTFKKRLTEQVKTTIRDLNTAEEFFESQAWFTIVRTSPPAGITCVGDIQGSIDPTEEDSERPEGIRPPRIGELTMTINWVKAHVIRQNIGTILMLQMAVYAKERGVYIMELDDDSDFKEFYRKLAFKYVDPACPEMCAVAADVWERAKARLVEKGEEATTMAVKNELKNELNKDVVLVTKWIRKKKGGRLERGWTEWRDKHERGYYRGKNGRLRRVGARGGARGGARVGLAMKAEPGLRF